MPQRIFNFSAGPAMLPAEVLEAWRRARRADEGEGVGSAAVSHRGKEFDAVIDEAIARCKSLLGLGDEHDVLFLQGGATQLFTTIPMSFLHGSADYLVSGEWSKKAQAAVKDVGGKANVVADTSATNFDHSAPEREWALDANADYFHVCTNETVHGHRLPTWPTAQSKNLIVDASSEFMSRPHPVKECALVYAGAQKNLGPAGVVVAIVRKDLYAKQKKTPSKLWDFKAQAEAKSMINTPPTFGVYILLETFRWLERQGGLAAMGTLNAQKAKLVYDAVDNSGGFYAGTVSVKEQRSHMNATFRLPGDELTEAFCKETAKQGMVGLKGYRTVGGVRASIYNAMPLEGVQALAQFMADFAKKNG